MLRITASLATEMGQALARMVRETGVAQSLWACVEDDQAEFWVFTSEIDAATERSLYALGVTLQRTFPSIGVRFHVINPRIYDWRNPPEGLPPGAEEILLAFQ